MGYLTKATTSCSMKGLIRISEEQWFMKGFQKAGERIQTQFLAYAQQWVLEKPWVATMVKEASLSQKNDILWVLAASFWGTKKREEQEIERIVNIEDCWQGVEYAYGGPRDAI